MKTARAKRNVRAQRPALPYLGNYSGQSRFAESYRTLRTNIQFSFMDREFRSLLITSSGAGEGKTCTVANLAFSLAQTGKNVLMIDADLRRPMLSKEFDANDSTGISGLLMQCFGTSVDKGNLNDYTVNDLFRLIGLQKKTGALRLLSRGEMIELFFLKGVLADCNWQSRPPEKKLIHVLVRNRQLTEDQAAMAVRRQRETGQRSGYILTSLGLLTREHLQSTLAIHIMEVLRLAIEMRDGTFSFSSLPESDIDGTTGELVDLGKLTGQIVGLKERFHFLKTGVHDAVIRVDSNLSLLPTGPLPPNPTELLASGRMSFLLGHLQKMYDVLIIDSPPILPASDALLLAPQVDGVVLVIKAGLINREMTGRVVEQLQRGKANLFGTVLNQVDVRREGYYKYYHKYYAGYYGEMKP